MADSEKNALPNSPVYITSYLINLIFGQAPDCQNEKMNERVVHIMNVARMTPNVNERTGETFKTARVLKDDYNGINENKMKVSVKKKKEFSSLLIQTFPTFKMAAKSSSL